MTKMTTCFAIIMIAGFAMLKMIDVQVETSHESLPEIVAQDTKLQEHSINYYSFKRSFDATILSLRTGDLSLADAIERVNIIGVQYNSDYFTHISYSEVGATKEARIARNLVGHIASFEEATDAKQSRLPELEKQLAQILEELEAAK